MGAGHVNVTFRHGVPVPVNDLPVAALAPEDGCHPEGVGQRIRTPYRGGGICIALAGGLRAWYLAGNAKVWRRVITSLAYVVVLILMVDLPILIGWQIFGRVWVAEELGIILTVLLALGVGAYWIIRGFGMRDAAVLKTAK